MNRTLNLISNLLNQNGIQYEYMRFNKELTYPYFVGEYSENGKSNESGKQETNFIITGTTLGTYLELENCKNKIIEILDGYRGIIDGNGITIFHQSSQPVQTGTAEYKRVQINFIIKEWRN